MYGDNNYYYIKYDQKIELLNQKQQEKIKLIMENKIYSNLILNGDYAYLILNDKNILGFFSLNFEEKFIKISSLYICKEYRNNSIATEVMKDIIFAIKHHSAYNYSYVIANSFVESSMFFLKRGFDFCKINKKLDYKKKNIILFYKRI